ncbi:MAG: TonB-dependent receptor plug domain-containing protein, partial [Flammeovirgaceae bacterium]
MKKILSILLITISTCAWSQYAEREENDTLKVRYLDEVVVSANRIAEQRRSVAQQIFVIRPSTIKSFNGQTTADLLQNTGFVAMQRSQQGGGSPILRGFEASRVLLVVDGVRMNNAIYRAGHLQNVLRVDNNNLDHAEVLLGPSSTVYGSDALGGVIHFYTRNPVLATNAQKSN